MPGPIATDFAGGAVLDLEETDMQITQQHPPGRTGLTKDIASAAAFLCGEDAARTDGQAIEVPKGYMYLLIKTLYKL